MTVRLGTLPATPRASVGLPAASAASAGSAEPAGSAARPLAAGLERRAPCVAPSPIAGRADARWDAPMELIFDAAIGQVGTGARAAVEEILTSQDGTGAWRDRELSVLSHTALASLLRGGAFAGDTRLVARMEAALACSWVSLLGGYAHDKIGERLLDPIPARALRGLHPVARAFHAAAFEQTLDGKRIPASVIEAARALNRSARIDPEVARVVRPAQLFAALSTLCAGANAAAPPAVAAAGATVAAAFAAAGPGLAFVAGLTLAHLAASFAESFFHDKVLHARPHTLRLAEKVGGPLGRAVIDAHYSHEEIHHRRTFNPSYTKQFASETEKAKLHDELVAMGQEEVIEEGYGVTLSARNAIKFIALIAPAIAAIGVAFGPAGLAGAAVSSGTYPLMSKVLHPYLHLTEAERAHAPAAIRWFMSTPVGEHISRQHYVHHQRAEGKEVNFNLFGWFGDWLRGRYDLPTNAEMEHLRADGVLG